MDPSWFPPSDRPLQSSGISIFRAAAICISALLLPPSKFRNLIAAPPIFWLFYNVRHYSSGLWEEDYLTLINISIILARFADISVLHEAERQFHRIRPDGSPRESAEDIQKMNLWQKFCWNVDLLTTMRGIDWNWRVKNVDQVSPTTSRKWFVFEQLMRAAYCFIYLDVHAFLARGRLQGVKEDLFSDPLSRQILLGWMTAFHSGCSMVLGCYLVAAVAVITGLYRPQSWPPLYGSFLGDGYTVRNIWGRCWHQLLRRTFETTNDSVMKLLRIPKGTLVSRYFQLYNAFLVSAIIHHMGALNCSYSAFVPYQFYFFMIQPVAITVEDIGIYLGKRMGLTNTWKTRALGYVWVSVFLSYSLRFVAAGFRATGIEAATHPLVANFSIMDRLFGH